MKPSSSLLVAIAITVTFTIPTMDPTVSPAPVPSPSGLLSAAVGAAACAGCPSIGTPTPPTPEDRHRFYRCVLEPLHVTCKPVRNDEIHKTATDPDPGVTSILIPIESWIPSVADRAVIRWRLFEARRLEFEEK
jgi:hypothetical protein